MQADFTTPLPPEPSRPERRNTFSEPLRAGLEFGSTLAFLPFISRLAPRGDGRPVLTLPGYGGADGSMAGVRQFLNNCGYRCYKLALGRNLDQGDDRIRSVDDATRFREKMVKAIMARVEVLYEETGEAITLVGWSLGGVYGVDVSQLMPEKIRQVVTLGSPFGDPRGTSLFYTMRRISRSTVPIESQDFHGWIKKGELRHPSVPISVIYSPTDGIVSTEIARLKNDNQVRYQAINSSHIGFAYNPRVYLALAKHLAGMNQRQ